VKNTTINVIDYDKIRFVEKTVESVKDIINYKKTKTVSWINLNSLKNEKLLDEIAKEFEVHPLILEDIKDVRQRPKVENLEKYTLIDLNMVYAVENKLSFEQISIIFSKNYLITFQQKETDVFDKIRQRIRTKTGKVRNMGTDYLAYLMVRAIIENYFKILEEMGERIEKLEERLVKNPSTKSLQQIHELKKIMIQLRRSAWPLREMMVTLEREESNVITKETKPYIRDLYGDTIQVIDTIEVFREMLSGMMDLYLSSISNKMNEVMKVLTIMSTIFIPLTFLTGLYGMNFLFMPEINWKYSYPVLILVMITISIIMMYYFKKKKWL